MDDPRVRIARAQEALDLALAAVRHARPDGPAKTARRAVQVAVDELAGALGADWSVLTPGGADMKRRDLLKLTGLALVPGELLERLAAPLPSKVDTGLLRALVGTQTSLAQSYYAAAPADLLAVVRRHVNRLEALQALPMDTGTRYGLDTLRADAAAMAGWLAFDAERRGEARAWFKLSQEAGRHAGDGALHGLAVASLGLLASNTHGGDPGEASYHLRQAAMALPDHTPDAARAWVLAQGAKEYAAARDDYGYFGALEQMGAALARGRQDTPPAGFWSTEGFFAVNERPGWRDTWAARGAACLGRDDAGPMLVRLAADTDDARMAAMLTLSLAEWHLARHEPEAAAQVAFGAVGSTPYWTERVRTFRTRLDPWADLPAVAELAEALAAT
jgi:hypothetical protein